MVDSKDNYSSDLGSDTVFSCLFLSFFLNITGKSGFAS